MGRLVNFRQLVEVLWDALVTSALIHGTGDLRHPLLVLAPTRRTCWWPANHVVGDNRGCAGPFLSESQHCCQLRLNPGYQWAVGILTGSAAG